MTMPPVHYTITGAGRYLAFRTECVEGRLLLSLIPDGSTHPFDVAVAFLDEPRLSVAPEIPSSVRGDAA